MAKGNSSCHPPAGDGSADSLRDQWPVMSDGRGRGPGLTARLLLWPPSGLWAETVASEPVSHGAHHHHYHHHHHRHHHYQENPRVDIRHKHPAILPTLHCSLLTSGNHQGRRPRRRRMEWKHIQVIIVVVTITHPTPETPAKVRCQNHVEAGGARSVCLSVMQNPQAFLPIASPKQPHCHQINQPKNPAERCHLLGCQSNAYPRCHPHT